VLADAEAVNLAVLRTAASTRRSSSGAEPVVAGGGVPATL